MPTGANDANGIYQYGTTDNRPTFADLLNLAQAATSLAIGAIKTRLTSLESSRDYAAGSSAARDTYWGAPANATQRRALQDLGARTIRTDKGWTEQYFANPTDGGSNPGGAASAGWYPVAGIMPMSTYYRNTAVNATVTETVLALDTAQIAKNAPTFSAGTWTVTQAGLYKMTTQIAFPSNASPLGGTVRWRKNGTSVRLGQGFMNTVNETTITVEWYEVLAVGDTVAVTIQAGGTVAVGIGGAPVKSWAGVEYVRAA